MRTVDRRVCPVFLPWGANLRDKRAFDATAGSGGDRMARPTTKGDLIVLANIRYENLVEMMEALTEKELETEFDFRLDEKKKEAHWKRDRNLRDVLVHLYEWHRLLLNWVASNMAGERKSFLPEPYHWGTYGEMNVEFWRKHQKTSLAESKAMLKESHEAVMAMIAERSDEELFSKGAFSWTGTTTLGSYCVSATSSHYDWAMKKIKAHRKNCRSV